jgi:hypothetical protein
MAVETMDYLSMVRRMIRAAGKRVAWADEPELRELVDMRKHLDEAIQHAVERQRDRGVTWQRIGDALGITRQAAQERFKVKPALTAMSCGGCGLFLADMAARTAHECPNALPIAAS